MVATSLTLTPPDTGWTDRVICRDMGAVMDGETPEDERHAKELCHVCPVKQECGSYALSLPPRQDVYGVAGGMTAKERERRRRATRRSRPPAPTEPPKECTGCGATKPADQFYRRPTVRSGRESRCNVCSTRQTQARRAAKKAAMAVTEQITDVKGIAS
jgi:WhiB family redox-sensing transcriptional regulator